MTVLRVFLTLLLAAGPLQSPPTFTGFDTGGNGYEVRWGDCDNDGDLDILIGGEPTAGVAFVEVT